MTAPSDDARGQNPFSTRFIRPGAIRYQFPGDTSDAELVRRLGELNWRAQIIGPHGSGKSTLIASLLEPMLAAGRSACLFALHDGQRRMPADWVKRVAQENANLLIVDGYEQLGLWARWSLGTRCRKHGWGLLVSAHADVGLPTLYRTESTLVLAQRVVEQLASPGDPHVGREAVERCFIASGGNVRDMLFALYDAYEAAGRTREKPGVPSAGRNDCAG